MNGGRECTRHVACGVEEPHGGGHHLHVAKGKSQLAFAIGAPLDGRPAAQKLLRFLGRRAPQTGPPVEKGEDAAVTPKNQVFIAVGRAKCRSPRSASSSLSRSPDKIKKSSVPAQFSKKKKEKKRKGGWGRCVGSHRHPTPMVLHLTHIFARRLEREEAPRGHTRNDVLGSQSQRIHCVL